ncbi:BppU family phage baseplate upper protein [Bacillus mobilis]
MTRTINSRENDRNGFKIIVLLKERGKPVDLTGYVVKYEAISPYGNFVRDDAVVTSAKDGVFEYTVSKEAVSSAGTWVGYFAFEKGNERFTTQDIRISLGSDVKQGNIPIENYIAEFDKLKKQIDTLQIAVDKVNVVKKTGDTMTGPLNLASTTYLKNGNSLIIEPASSTTTMPNWRMLADSGGVSLVPSKTIGGADWDWSKVVRLGGDTSNILKKTGDTMTGVLYLRNNWEHAIPDGSKGVTVVVNDSVNKWAIGPKVGGNTTWANELSMDLNTGTITVADLKTKKDTTWTNLTLINGATVDAGNTPRYIRKGDVIYIVGAVTNITDSMTIVNLPTGLRPTSNCAFAVAYLSTDSKKYAGEINVRPDGRITLDWMWNNVKSVSFCISYHL